MLSDEGGIAPDIVGMLLSVPFLVVSPCAVGFLLIRVRTLKVIRVPFSPVLVVVSFLFLAAAVAATCILSPLNPRVGREQAKTKRTLPALRHKPSP